MQEVIMYVDNKSTIEDIEGSNAAALHQWSMMNNPQYAKVFTDNQEYEKFVANDPALEDTSIDIIPLGLGVTNNIIKASQGLGNIIRPSSINAIADVGRREAIKTGGAGLATATAATSGLGMVMPKIAASTIKPKAPLSLATLSKEYEASKAIRSMLPNGITGNVSPTTYADILKTAPSSISKGIKGAMDAFNKADVSMNTAMGGAFKHSDDFLFDVRDIYRWNKSPDKAAAAIKNSLANNPELAAKYKHLGSQDDIIKAFAKVRELDTAKVSLNNNMYKVMDDADYASGNLRRSAIYSKDPVLNPEELASEITRQKGKLEKGIKTVDDDISRIKKEIAEGVEIEKGVYAPKKLVAIEKRHGELLSKVKYTKEGRRTGLSKKELEELRELDSTVDYRPSSYDLTVNIDDLAKLTAKKQSHINTINERINNMQLQLDSLGKSGVYTKPDIPKMSATQPARSIAPSAGYNQPPPSSF